MIGGSKYSLPSGSGGFEIGEPGLDDLVDLGQRQLLTRRSFDRVEDDGRVWIGRSTIRTVGSVG